MLRAGLDSSLGPGEVYDVGGFRCLEFHPLSHWSKRTIRYISRETGAACVALVLDGWSHGLSSGPAISEICSHE